MTTDSLSDRAFLIAWDPRRQKMTGGSNHRNVVAAAVLVELWLAGRIKDERGKVALATPRPAPGQPLHPDRVQQILLRRLADSRPRTWKHWVASKPKDVHDAVRARLQESHAIEVTQRSVLGIRWAQVTVRDEPRCRDLVNRCETAVLGTALASDVRILDAALVALVAAAELNTALSGHQRRAYRERIASFAARSGPAAKALRSVITDSQSSDGAAG